MSSTDALFKVNGSADQSIDAEALHVAQQYDLGHEADFASYRVEPPVSAQIDEISLALNDLIATCDPPELVADSQDARPVFLRSIKRELHQLITYYVNQSSTRQVAFNASALRAISLLMARLTDSQAEVKQLRQEVESMHK